MDQNSEKGGGAATPFAEGFRMPGRFEEHARSLVTWPPEAESAGTDLEGFRAEIAALVDTVSRYEPVTLIADPSDAAEARGRCGERAEVVAVEVECAWIRDNGPIFVRDATGRVAGVHFGFNGWGGRVPYEATAEMPAAVLEHLGIRRYSTSFICEGGGISVDGEGTLITTAQVMQNANRYAGLSRAEVEASLHDYLGIERVIWLGLGLAEDRQTDGHVDNVVEFVAPGCVIAQTMSDPSNANYGLLRDNLEVLRSARDARGRQLEIIEMDVLPYAQADDGRSYAIPYTNAYVINGAVIAPKVDPRLDERGYKILEQAFPGRTVIPAPSFWQAVGGGGLGCVTQQVPAGVPA